MALIALPPISRTTGAQDDYPFIVLKIDGKKQDITNDFIEISVGNSLDTIAFSGDSNDPSLVEKDDPTEGGWTLHMSPAFLPNVTPAVVRYQIRLTPNAIAPNADSVIVGEGEFTFNPALYTQPDFTLVPAQTSASIVAGGNTSFGVDVNSLGNFSGIVVLGVAVEPVVGNGPSLSIGSPAIVPSGGLDTKTLSIGTVLATPLGDYVVTITGVSGSITHTTTVAVTVT